MNDLEDRRWEKAMQRQSFRDAWAAIIDESGDLDYEPTWEETLERERINGYIRTRDRLRHHLRSMKWRS